MIPTQRFVYFIVYKPFLNKNNTVFSCFSESFVFNLGGIFQGIIHLTVKKKYSKFDNFFSFTYSFPLIYTLNQFYFWKIMFFRMTFTEY